MGKEIKVPEKRESKPEPVKTYTLLVRIDNLEGPVLELPEFTSLKQAHHFCFNAFTAGFVYQTYKFYPGYRIFEIDIMEKEVKR